MHCYNGVFKKRVQPLVEVFIIKKNIMEIINALLIDKRPLSHNYPQPRLACYATHVSITG